MAASTWWPNHGKWITNYIYLSYTFLLHGGWPTIDSIWAHWGQDGRLDKGGGLRRYLQRKFNGGRRSYHSYNYTTSVWHYCACTIVRLVQFRSVKDHQMLRCLQARTYWIQFLERMHWHYMMLSPAIYIGWKPNCTRSAPQTLPPFTQVTEHVRDNLQIGLRRH